ncbi:MAG: ABC transporter permease [Eubacterium sp.]|nr:ABC transporter permease [Eubacterium sp.]
MNFAENLRLAWSCVRSNKMRSILTMLGIIIGISAVITISTLGSSLRQTISGTFSDMMSTNQLAFMWINNGDDSQEEEPVKFDLQNCYEFREAFAGQISSVCVNDYIGPASYYYGEDKKMVNVSGYSEGFCETNNYEVIMGRDLEFQDSFERRKVCVVSDNFVKYALNDMSNPIGKRIEVETSDGIIVSAYIIGVYKLDEKSSISGKADTPEKDKVTELIVPVTYCWDLNETPEKDQYNEVLYVNGAPGIDGVTLKENVTRYFESKKKSDSHYYLLIQSLEEQLKTISKALDVITIVISIIAAISLIVGGIGVMNIMLVSVVERTKEIGIRKALGAKNKVIEAQFLVESVLICAIGGIIGILMGLLSGGIIAIVAKVVISRLEEYSFISVNVQPPITMIIISFLFSTLVGVVFGLYPARRAARLSPIDALRYE